MSGGKSNIQTATRSRFDICVAALLVTEGGLVDNPSDPGGITQFGISLRFLVAEGKLPAAKSLCDFNRDGTIDAQDIRAMMRDQAIALYRRCFWDRAGIGALAPPLDAVMLDQCVNMGSGTAIRLLQHAAGINSANGLLDDATDAAVARSISAHGMTALLAAYRAAAKAHYHAIVLANPKRVGDAVTYPLAKFEKGWDARVDRLGSI